MEELLEKKYEELGEEIETDGLSKDWTKYKSIWINNLKE